jgi:hypothetical protein
MRFFGLVAVMAPPELRALAAVYEGRLLMAVNTSTDDRSAIVASNTTVNDQLR